MKPKGFRKGVHVCVPMYIKYWDVSNGFGGGSEEKRRLIVSQEAKKKNVCHMELFSGLSLQLTSDFFKAGIHTKASGTASKDAGY